MIRKCIGATVSAALCLASLAPAAAVAQEYRFSGFDAPRGASATVNLRVPLDTDSRRRPTLGITAAFGQQADLTVLGGSTTRAIRVGDLRFDQEGLNAARLMGYDLLDPNDPRLHLTGKFGGKKVWVFIGFLVLGGFALCLIEICDDDDGNSSSNSS